ncbi:MAG: glycosyltransferase [Lachnospiraceae bacterium]|nr:glycosyltransferase [Lachnospiraceae bacterium]
MKKILYLFDDINYPSGAQKVTFFQMKTLSRDYKVSVFSLSKPQAYLRPELKGISIVGKELWERTELFSYSLKKALSLKEISFLKKIQRMFYSVVIRIGKGEAYLNYLFYREIKQKFEKFDVVIVVSEASKLRELVSNLKHPKKIQWIHTDYALWSEFSDWTKMITKKDSVIYKKFDWIVTLSEYSRKGLLKKLPGLKDQTVVIPNLIDGKTILKKAEEDLDIEWNDADCHMVTVGRVDREKAYDRVLDICGKLKAEGYSFCWYIVGDGPLKGHLEKRIKAEQLEEYVKLTGRLENPYPLMKRCDWFVLLSEYEGTPVTIDEAMVLGVPVIATDVGGIAEQMGRYGKGVVLKGDTLYEDLKKEIIQKKQMEPIEYRCLNKKIICSLKGLLEK